MDIRVNKMQPPSALRMVSAPEKNASKGFSQAFQQSMDGNRKGQLYDRAAALLDELAAGSRELCRNMDLDIFQDYCRRLGAILQEIMADAYLFRSETVQDGNGRNRVFATVTVIDQTMDRMGRELVSGAGSLMEFISGVDEIRGLITDLFS